MNDLTNIEIPTENFPAFEKKLVSLNKKLAKRGLAPMTIENKHTGTMMVKNENGKTFYVEVQVFDIKGEYPLIKGYDFVAFIDHTENMILSEKPEMDLEVFRHRRVCDHCGSNRKRSKTYILQNRESGELVQIGSSCVKAFLGVCGEDLQSIVSAFTSILKTRFNFTDPENVSFGRVPLMVPVSEALNTAAKIVKDFGFRPSTEPGSTKELLMTWMFGDNESRKMSFPNGYDFQITENVYEKVKKFVTEAPETDFIRNCRQILENGYVSAKYFGFVAGMIQGMMKHQKVKEKETEGPKEFSFVPVGEKVNEKAVFKSFHTFEGYYGITRLYTFENNDHCLVWFTSKSLDVEVGKSYNISATVKENKEYKGTKQTVITRAKVA